VLPQAEYRLQHFLQECLVGFLAKFSNLVFDYIFEQNLLNFN